MKIFYKKINFFFVSVTLAFSAPCFSQIIYSDVSPDSVMNVFGSTSFHLSKDFSINYLDTGTINLWFRPLTPNEVVLSTGPNCQVVVNNITANLPLKLQAGDSIGSNQTWASVSYTDLNEGNTQGFWLNGVVDKFLGIRFKLTPAGNWLYGWVRLDVDMVPNNYTIKDYAYNSQTSSTFILANQGTQSGITENRPPAFKLYPNPSSGSFTISTPAIASGNVVVNIYNVIGGKVASFNSNPGVSKALTINIANQPDGIYFVEVKTDLEIRMEKVELHR